MNLRNSFVGVLILTIFVFYSSALAGPLGEAAFHGDLQKVKELIFRGVAVNENVEAVKEEIGQDLAGYLREAFDRIEGTA
jgi:hypothetical protein